MAQQTLPYPETLAALQTVEGELLAVRGHVGLKVGAVGEAPAAHLAHVRLLLGVGARVGLQGAGHDEGLVAFRAGYLTVAWKGRREVLRVKTVKNNVLTRVRLYMYGQVVSLFEGAVAELAFERPFARMVHDVLLKLVGVSEGLPAVLARFFGTLRVPLFFSFMYADDAVLVVRFYLDPFGFYVLQFSLGYEVVGFVFDI